MTTLRDATDSLIDPSLLAYWPMDDGLVGAVMDPTSCANLGNAIVAGTVYVARFRAVASATISKIQFIVGTAGSNLTSGQNQVGVYSAGGLLLGYSADMTTHFEATGLVGGTALTAESSGSLALAQGQLYYAGIVASGTSSPTGPRLYGGANQTGASANASAPSRFMSIATGQTSGLPTSFTPSSGTPVNAWPLYFAVM
jgi:hypothetical protein